MEAKLLTAKRFIDMETGISYRYVYSETEYFRPHYHDYCEIFLVLSGRARHMVGHREFSLSPGDLVFIRPSDTHDYISSGGGYAMLNIAFTLETLQGLFAFLGDGFPATELMNVSAPPQVKLSQQTVDAINARMTAISAGPQDVPALKTALRILLFEIFSQHFSGFVGEKKQLPLWLASACDTMRKNGSFVDGSEAFFALTDRSREHVCRCMKKYMGVTVSEYVNDLRLSYIASMLRLSNHTVAQIVFDSGFNNLSWAAELFKRKYGMTMRAYRSDT
jgi:AraC family cel operon transcriptional repressor